jgi:hypothetical protein
MTDNQLMKLSVNQLKNLYNNTKDERLRSAINNQWDKHQQQGELMQKCKQLLEFKNNH